MHALKGLRVYLLWLQILLSPQLAKKNQIPHLKKMYLMYIHSTYHIKKTISGTTSKTYCQAHGMFLAKFTIFNKFLDILYMTRSKLSFRTYLFYVIMMIG
jgi:hypothetical protein